MKNYKYISKVLFQLLGDDSAVRLTSGSFMPLSVEKIGQSADGHQLISVCHYGEQNGDLMRDPDMVFAVHSYDDHLLAEPISFRNDYMGTDQEVYRYDEQGKRTHVDTKLKKDLISFTLTWFKNLRAQGFLDKDVTRERLS